MGLLLGVLGGPVGVLVGGAYGLLVGSMFDLYDVAESDSALGQISTSARFGHTALLAVVDERSPEVVDAAMSEVGGTVVRRSVADVEAEIAAAEDAERKAKREARKELIRGRHEQNKTTVNAKVDELKAKLDRGQKSDSADARPWRPEAGADALATWRRSASGQSARPARRRRWPCSAPGSC